MAIILSTLAFALTAHAVEPTPAQVAFDRLKSLQGRWSAKVEDATTTVEYRLTGGGKAICETQFPGTAHEMVTMYVMGEQDLTLTHYCAAQNQPRMKFVPGPDPAVLNFDFVSADNLRPGGMHMHSLKLQFLSADHVRAEWASEADGKPGFVAKFDMTRAKS